MTHAFLIFGFILLILFEAGFVAALASPWNAVALVPLALIGFVAQGRGREVWGLGLLAGLILDAFSVLPTGTLVVVLLAFIGLVRVLSRRWFSSQSWASLAGLGVVSLVVYFVLLVTVRGGLAFITKDIMLGISLTEAWRVVGFGTLLSSALLLAVAFIYGVFQQVFGHRLRVFKRV